MPTPASPLRAGAASRLPWPTAPRSASSIWTTTPWVRLKEAPIQELGTIGCQCSPTSGGGEGDGDLEPNGQQVHRSIHHRPWAWLASSVLTSYSATYPVSAFAGLGMRSRIVRTLGRLWGGRVSRPAHDCK